MQKKVQILDKIIHSPDSDSADISKNNKFNQLQ